MIEPRKRYSGGQQDIPSVAWGIKSTACNGRKTAVSSATWRALETPPGSKSGACTYRGSPGTWESQLSPRDESAGVWAPADQTPWRRPGISQPWRRADSGTRTNESKRGIGERALSEATRDGQLAVLAEHSTDGVRRMLDVGKVGNRDPRDPLQGRRSRAQRSVEWRDGRDQSSQTVSTALQQIAEQAVVTAGRVAKLCAGGSTIAPLVTEEPDERIVHVRICGGPGRVTAGPTRMRSVRRAAPRAPQHNAGPLGARS